MINSWDGKKQLRLLKCPFCGGEPDLKHIGNDHTKKRSIEIKCKACGIKRKDSAITKPFHWLEEIAVRYWNKRK